MPATRQDLLELLEQEAIMSCGQPIPPRTGELMAELQRTGYSIASSKKFFKETQERITEERSG